ncbi:T9SS type B sorting domain-containing protein [Flavobacterium suncheonense]|uniref:CshA domain-containing protein n=1 Tax=Flavobacterium suncheonense GH29-5 = DSM 17707 TaxID=1121899 RepID=A0A0A2MAV2_9FLAO|nr:gliding motility-associated C-terminal domain-containing protein [Flavobacterium suncheonense]KGO89399.1 hypothetical protein Q764_08450 [Flavobacterium suncheonense GH29-5 = DSM 17707]
MKKTLHATLCHIVITTVLLLKFQASEAQCADSFIRPADGFQVQGWSPRCHNGTDGEIHFTGISSTAGPDDFTNQNYAVRILSGPNGATTIPITPNSASFTITGLAAGTYVLDIIDQCGGNSADKTVTLSNPPLNSSLTPATHIFKDITVHPALGECGNMLKFRITITSTNTAGDLICVFTNHNGNTLTHTKPIERTSQPANKVVFLDLEIPSLFFDEQNVTYTISNLCGTLQGGAITLPTTSDIIYGMPSIADTSDSQNQCLIGYDIKVFRDFMTNPVTVTVEEAANPGTTPLDFMGNPITPKTVNLLHLNSVPMGMATIVGLGLKYNTHYSITFTDACGKTVTKNMVQTVTPFNPAITCNTDSSVADTGGYFDDASLLKFNGVAISSNAVGPLTITVNSGPATYTTSSGTGNSATAAAIQYPYSTVFTSPFLNDYIANDYLKTFPPGTYNITITDACGKTYTFNHTVSCVRNFNLSHSLQTCGNVSENSIGIQLNIPKALLGTKATIYKTDGSIALTGIINSGAPFYYLAYSSLGTLTFNLPNNNQYFFRYGGVTETGELAEPAQFGGPGALPRLQGGYLYEYAFETALTPFRFEAIQACGTSVTMTATGGTAPYTFTVLDASGNVQLFPNQSAASFSGLTTGITYTAKAIDACGREFTQQFEVFALPVANIESITQPTCQNNTGSVTVNNLPSDWTITVNPGDLSYQGTASSFSINDLQPGAYTFTIQDNITTCTANQNLNAVLNAVPLCPIATDDSSPYQTGVAVSVDVLQNDTTGAVVNPATVSLVPQANSTNIITNNHNSIISMVVPSEGTWSVDPVTGQITFEPFPDFSGVPSAIAYNVQDYDNNTSNIATVSLDLLPIAVNDTAAYIPGSSITLDITANDTPGDLVNPATVSLILPDSPMPENPENTTQLLQITITDEGTWSINNTTGAATFTPIAGFSGIPTAQQYRVRDYEGNLSNMATIQLQLSCNFEVVCPTFPDTTVACYSEIPTGTQLTIAEFAMLGNADGSIGNTPCGVIKITASNSPFLGCNTTVERTYTITEYQDNNGNGIKDADENTILNTVVCSQVFHVNDTVAPVFNGTLPQDLTLEYSDSIPAALTLTASDNCGNPTVTFDEETVVGTCPDNTKIIRTWTAADICGNETVHTQTITIIDTTPPVFTGALPTDQTLECGDIPTAPTLTATDGFGEVSVTFEEQEVQGDCKSKYSLVRTWTATDSCGNTATHTQTLYFNCQIKVYNAVSPNGDGKNDIFYLEGIECYPRNTVEIFNRWGAKVFETTGYDNTSKVFRGKSEGKNTVSKNEALPTGTYFYILRYDFSANGNQNEQIEKTGYLYVVNQ